VSSVRSKTKSASTTDAVEALGATPWTRALVGMREE
jgi:hypothetical protein